MRGFQSNMGLHANVGFQEVVGSCTGLPISGTLVLSLALPSSIRRSFSPPTPFTHLEAQQQWVSDVQSPRLLFVPLPPAHTKPLGTLVEFLYGLQLRCCGVRA